MIASSLFIRTNRIAFYHRSRRTRNGKILGDDVPKWDHFLARWGVNRSRHRVEPGLYALNNPTAASPVFVTANYTLSFDALRSALDGMDGYILVLDTRGINVWCAAGKGMFGTDELVHRLEVVNLHEVVDHGRLILPQLGAAGVSAYEVVNRSGFRVEYGPVRAPDLPEYLRVGQATPEMRRVRFNLLDRLALIPVELTHVFLPMAIVSFARLKGCSGCGRVRSDGGHPVPDSVALAANP